MKINFIVVITVGFATLFIMVFFQRQLLAEPIKVSASESVNITKQQARALTFIDTEQNQAKTLKKTISASISELTDNQGLVYLGAVINKAELSPYLALLETLLPNDFEHYRQNQATRDHQQFHMTIINPYEYQTMDKNKLVEILGESFNHSFIKPLTIKLLGVGSASKDDKKTYFVVANSDDGQLIRQVLLLKPKDFHVTLGFNPSDIYGVNKDIKTLIQ
ncbi:MAG: hypothetical protein OCD00_20240 [Colwellia sp.]